MEKKWIGLSVTKCLETIEKKFELKTDLLKSLIYENYPEISFFSRIDR